MVWLRPDMQLISQTVAQDHKIMAFVDSSDWIGVVCGVDGGCGWCGWGGGGGGGVVSTDEVTWAQNDIHSTDFCCVIECYTLDAW